MQNGTSLRTNLGHSWQLEKTIANKLHNVYYIISDTEREIPPNEFHSPLDDPGILDDLEQKLKNNLRGIINKYAAYIRCVQQSVKNAGVNAKDLRDFLLTLTAFEHNNDQKPKLFVREKLKKLDDIDEIIKMIEENYATFLDFEILQSIVDEFVSDTHDKLNYKNHLQEYVNNHKITEFSKINPLLRNFKDTSKELILKYDIKLTAQLGSLKEHKRAVANVMGLRSSVVRLLSIKEGCVNITTLIPSHIADYIFTSETTFTAEQKDEFQAHSLLWLECNGCTFKFEEKIETLSHSSGMPIHSG